MLGANPEHFSGSAVDAFPWIVIEPGQQKVFDESFSKIAAHGSFAAIGAFQPTLLAGIVTRAHANPSLQT